MWVTSSTTNVLKPNVIALGNFDGIHRGHQQVLQPIIELGSQDGNQPYATVVSFDPHPRSFFSGQSRQLLTPLSEKVELLERLGISQLVLLPFNRELAALSPAEFIEKILVQQLETACISVGQDFRFGKARIGTATDLQAIATTYGIKTHITALYNCWDEQNCQETVRISSSLIRQALEKGDLSTANRMLGRTYSLTGKVITGQKIGRTIGFPTANLQLPPEKFLPRYGVYSVQVSLQQQSTPIIGVMNLGCRPTVAGTTPTVEVHLLDWSGDLYGQVLRVSLAKFLRPEQKFASLDALKAQIAKDCELAREMWQFQV